MKTFHSLIAGLQLAAPILAGRIAIPLLLFIAGMVVVQPCAAQGGTWTETGSLVTARWYHTATLLPNGKVLVSRNSRRMGAAFRGHFAANLNSSTPARASRIGAFRWN